MLSVRTSLPMTIALVLCASGPAAAHMETAALGPLDGDVDETGTRLGAQALSGGGRWVLFALAAEANAAALTVVDVAGDTRHVIARAEAPRFDYDTRLVALAIEP